MSNNLVDVGSVGKVGGWGEAGTNVMRPAMALDGSSGFRSYLGGVLWGALRYNNNVNIHIPYIFFSSMKFVVNPKIKYRSVH